MAQAMFRAGGKRLESDGSWYAGTWSEGATTLHAAEGRLQRRVAELIADGFVEIYGLAVEGGWGALERKGLYAAIECSPLQMHEGNYQVACTCGWVYGPKREVVAAKGKKPTELPPEVWNHRGEFDPAKAWEATMALCG